MTVKRPACLALVILAVATAPLARAQTAAPPAKAPTSITVPAAKASAEEALSALVDEPPAAAAVLSARAPLNARDLRLIQDQLQRVIARVMPATVSVELGRAAGSGVIVSRDGLVLTAAHVIGRPGRIAWVELPDGRRLRGRTLGANHEADAGMIRLENPPSDLPYAPLSKRRKLSVGEWVITTGQPGGIVSDRAPPVRLGRVLVALDDMVCTDCKLVGGDSGGPLFNMRGEVVAIHSSIGPMITHNFHVPAAAFRDGWDRLLASDLWGGRFDELTAGRPMIGVSGRTEEGRCLITQVYPGMPAGEAGVEAGDVITAVDGRPIAAFDQLSNIVSFKVPGQKIRLTIDRDGESFDLEVPLARVEGRPAPEDDE